MSITNKDSYVSRVIQEDRTVQLETVIDDRLEYMATLSDSLLRWPIPRPILLRRYKQTLGCLAALSKQLAESKAADAQLAQQGVTPVNMAGEVAALLDTPDDTDRRPASPREVAPEAYDYANDVETIAFGESKQSLFEDHEALLEKARTDVATPHEEIAKELDPEVAAIQKRLEAKKHAAQKLNASGVVRAALPKDTFAPGVEVNGKYL